MSPRPVCCHDNFVNLSCADIPPASIASSQLWDYLTAPHSLCW
ncbi:hypothetical protein [Azospirillum palustre]